MQLVWLEKGEGHAIAITQRLHLSTANSHVCLNILVGGIKENLMLTCHLQSPMCNYEAFLSDLIRQINQQRY